MFQGVVFYLEILWYPLSSKILSSFWGIVFYIRNRILLGSTTKKTLLRWSFEEGITVLGSNE